MARGRGGGGSPPPLCRSTGAPCPTFSPSKLSGASVRMKLSSVFPCKCPPRKLSGGQWEVARGPARPKLARVPNILSDQFFLGVRTQCNRWEEGPVQISALGNRMGTPRAFERAGFFFQEHPDQDVWMKSWWDLCGNSPAAQWEMGSHFEHYFY